MERTRKNRDVGKNKQQQKTKVRIEQFTSSGLRSDEQAKRNAIKKEYPSVKVAAEKTCWLATHNKAIATHDFGLERMEVHKEDPEEVFEMLEKLGEGYDQL
jgi:hypothetical protein